jgi:phosphohistidine phosphatase SixA
LLALAASVAAGTPAVAQLSAVTAESAEGRSLVERLRSGGHVLFFRHADTAGMPCDSLYEVGRREGQRNLSQAGRQQSKAIGTALEGLDIPIGLPVLAGPVFRARDTAELAFGKENVRVAEDLTADDYARGNLDDILEGHRRLMRSDPPTGTNTALVGHRTPAIMVLGPTVGGKAFPEGAALVLDPAGNGDPEILGILHLAPIEGAGFHSC